MLDLIERKAAGEEIAVQPEAEEPAAAPDLMAALEASLAAVRSDEDGQARAEAAQALDRIQERRRQGSGEGGAKRAPPGQEVPPPGGGARVVRRATGPIGWRSAAATWPQHDRVALIRFRRLSVFRRPRAPHLCTVQPTRGHWPLRPRQRARRLRRRAGRASCGARPSHAVVEKALDALENLEHRGAEGADPNTGDGAGILLQIPDAFLRAAVAGVELPAAGPLRRRRCATCPREPERRAELEQLIEETRRRRGPARDLAGATSRSTTRHVGDTARMSAPLIRQVLIGAGEGIADQDAFERKLYVIRRVLEREGGAELALPSFSVAHDRLQGHADGAAAAAVTSPICAIRAWRRASRSCTRASRRTPSRAGSSRTRSGMIAHNGEVNTLRGNVNWMRARESQLASELFGEDLHKVIPVGPRRRLGLGDLRQRARAARARGRSIPHAVMMMVPEAYRTRTDLDPDVRGFYDFHSCLIEPWDGPAAVVFTDGRVAGAVLDRNGLRPGPLDPGHRRLRRARLRDRRDDRRARAHPAQGPPRPRQGVPRRPRGGTHRRGRGGQAPGRPPQALRRVVRARASCTSTTCPSASREHPRIEPLRSKQLAFGYSQEDLRMMIAPMATKGEEPVASMGNDAALAVLSDRQPPLFAYFKQLFAQVTNPPIDPIRESVVMSLHVGVGAERQPARRDPRAGPPARHGPADPAQPRAREAAPGLARRLRRGDDRHHVADRAGPDGMAARLDRRSARRRPTTSSTGPTS